MFNLHICTLGSFFTQYTYYINIENGRKSCNIKIGKFFDSFLIFHIQLNHCPLDSQVSDSSFWFSAVKLKRLSDFDGEGFIKRPTSSSVFRRSKDT